MVAHTPLRTAMWFCACRFNCWYWMCLWCDCLIKFNTNRASKKKKKKAVRWVKRENYWQLA